MRLVEWWGLFPSWTFGPRVLDCTVVQATVVRATARQLSITHLANFVRYVIAVVNLFDKATDPCRRVDTFLNVEIWLSVARICRFFYHSPFSFKFTKMKVL